MQKDALKNCQQNCQQTGGFGLLTQYAGYRSFLGNLGNRSPETGSGQTIPTLASKSKRLSVKVLPQQRPKTGTKTGTQKTTPRVLKVTGFSYMTSRLEGNVLETIEAILEPSEQT